jgi:hypothetical protein
MEVIGDPRTEGATPPVRSISASMNTKALRCCFVIILAVGSWHPALG